MLLPLLSPPGSCMHKGSGLLWPCTGPGSHSRRVTHRLQPPPEAPSRGPTGNNVQLEEGAGA